MAKQTAIQSGVIILVIGVASALSAFATNKMSQGREQGALQACVENNTANISRLDKEGTQQLKLTLERLAVVETVLSSIKENMVENRKYMSENRQDMKELKAFLMKPPGH